MLKQLVFCHSVAIQKEELSHLVTANVMQQQHYYHFLFFTDKEKSNNRNPLRKPFCWGLSLTTPTRSPSAVADRASTSNAWSDGRSGAQRPLGSVDVPCVVWYVGILCLHTTYFNLYYMMCIYIYYRYTHMVLHIYVIIHICDYRYAIMYSYICYYYYLSLFYIYIYVIGYYIYVYIYICVVGYIYICVIVYRHLHRNICFWKCLPRTRASRDSFLSLCQATTTSK